MDPAAVRDRILEDHARIRDQLDALGRLNDRFEKGGVEIGEELRELGTALCEIFAAHLSFEDQQLVPVLREIPGIGSELAERLEREHREQRELLYYLVARLQDDGRPTQVITQELRSFCEYVRSDMTHEEQALSRAPFASDAAS